MFSIITPTYNNSSVIGKTISSVLAQTVQDFEMVVVDDGSSDNTRDVVMSFDDRRIRYYKIAKNSGVHVARNLGLDKAKGDYVIFLDSDDELYSFCLEEFSKLKKTFPNVGFLYAPYITSEGEITGLNLNESGFVSYEDFLCDNLTRRIKPGIVCIKSELAKKIKFVAPNLDFIYYRYLTKETDTYYLSKPLAKYNFIYTPNSMHVSRRIPDICKSITRGIALDNFLKDFKDDYLKNCPSSYSRCSYGAAVGLILNGNYYRGIVRSKDAFFYSSFKLSYLSVFLLSLMPFISTIILKLVFKLKKSYRVNMLST